MENRRQKILLGAIVALATVALGWMVGKPALIDPYYDDQLTLDRLLKDQERLRQAEDILLPRAVREWKSFASRSLGRDAQEVKNRLQPQIEELAEAHHLIGPRFHTLSFRGGRKLKGVVLVPVNVTATGTLPNITAFLGAVYELPYLVRVSRVTLSRVPNRIKSIKNVKMIAIIESLALPLGKENKGFIRSEDLVPFDLPDDPEALPKREPPVLAMAIADYGRMNDKQPFHAEDPPPPPKRTPTTRAVTGSRVVRNPKTTRKTTTPRKTARAVPDPALTTLVAGILNYPPSEFVESGQREVILRDTKTKKRTYFGLGDELELRDSKGVTHPKGTIILIHPYGVVTHFENETRFYRVGSLLRDPEVIDDLSDLELW